MAHVLVEFCNALILVFCYAYPQRGFAFYGKDGAAHISAFYFGYALTVLPGGILADKIGYRRTILFSLIGMAAVTALMSTITDYNMAWGLRFLLGVMSGPVQASCLSAIGDHFGPNQRGAA